MMFLFLSLCYMTTRVDAPMDGPRGPGFDYYARKFWVNLPLVVVFDLIFAWWYFTQ